MRKEELLEIAAYHNDAISSLSLYFSELSPTFSVRFLGYDPENVVTELADRLEETDFRSSFVVLAGIEAAFRKDYSYRCRKRLKDDLSRAFRQIYKKRKEIISLDQDIFEAWKEKQIQSRQLISELRGAFNFRHWFAHGRSWSRKLNRSKFDFNYVYSLGDYVINNLPLYGLD